MILRRRFLRLFMSLHLTGFSSQVGLRVFDVVADASSSPCDVEQNEEFQPGGAGSAMRGVFSVGGSPPPLPYKRMDILIQRLGEGVSVFASDRWRKLDLVVLDLHVFLRLNAPMP